MCADGSYYCGWTFDLEKRVKAHQAGKGSRYTRSHLPVELAYYEKCENRASAMRREKQLKRKSHTDKEALAKEFALNHE
jgi:putative endonuclease